MQSHYQRKNIEIYFRRTETCISWVINGKLVAYIATKKKHWFWGFIPMDNIRSELLTRSLSQTIHLPKVLNAVVRLQAIYYLSLKVSNWRIWTIAIICVIAAVKSKKRNCTITISTNRMNASLFRAEGNNY